MKKAGTGFGSQTVNIAGHKVPYALLGAAAAILGAFLVWKAHRSGASIAGAGPAPVDTTGTTSVFGQDNTAALADLSQQLSDLGAQMNNVAPTAAGAQGTPESAASVIPSWQPGSGEVFTGFLGTSNTVISGATENFPALYADVLNFAKVHPGSSEEIRDPQGRTLFYFAPAAPEAQVGAGSFRLIGPPATIPVTSV
jgi:hypothetical protein